MQSSSADGEERELTQVLPKIAISCLFSAKRRLNIQLTMTQTGIDDISSYEASQATQTLFSADFLDLRPFIDCRTLRILQVENRRNLRESNLEFGERCR